MNNLNEVKTLVSEVLQEAILQGADAAEVSADLSNGFSLQVRMGATETLEYHNNKGLDITVYLGQAQGSASVSDTSFPAIKAAVAAALNIAKYTQADPFAGLPNKTTLAQDYPDLDLSHPWAITPDLAADLALSCEQQALSLDKRITNSEGVSLSTQNHYFAYGNSQGFLGAYPSTRHDMSCVLVAKEYDEMQRDYSYTLARDPDELQPTRWLAEQAVQRTVARLQPRSVATQHAPVIFSAEVARGLLGHFVGAIRGGALYRKTSFLYEALEQMVFPSWIQIQEHPHLLKGLGSSPFDSDGVATHANYFIQDGQLISYALGTYSARKLGLHSTGNAEGVHNLTISTNVDDFANLLKKMHTGLLVTELMGQGVNITTGDYSRGASGFWVENGVIQYPVHQITIAGNLREMFKGIIAISNDIDMRGNIRTGSILIDKMMIAGA